MPEREDIVKRLDLDRRTVEGLRSQGDDSAVARIIEHHFVADNHDDLHALLRVGEMLGFEAADSAQPNARPAADLLTEQPISLNERAIESLAMLSLAEAFQCKYEGWGTFVMKNAGA
jgi:regulator of RNase E activity RraB